ncbi:MAG: hypothetical protein PHR26_01205 [Candidatus ainarchaeum sp.]|nr:hypothetical protein [Candidatus ainarchaeum sp.]MDD3976259.1 hypothetical protein [Candidatus ainarchaeum sp.]
MIKYKYPTKINIKEDNQLNIIYNKYFKKTKQEADLNLNKLNLLINKFPKSETIIYDKNPIGEITIIPTNLKNMNLFLKEKISEQELIDNSINKVNLKNFKCIYLCYFIILKKYRRKKIIYKQLKKIVKYYIKINPKITLFVWPFSEVGEKISKKLSNELNLPIIIKK